MAGGSSDPGRNHRRRGQKRPRYGVFCSLLAKRSPAAAFRWGEMTLFVQGMLAFETSPVGQKTYPGVLSSENKKDTPPPLASYEC